MRSATVAMMVLPTAPVPCSARPMIMPVMESESAAIALPAAKRIKPIVMIFFRPK